MDDREGRKDLGKRKPFHINQNTQTDHVFCHDMKEYKELMDLARDDPNGLDALRQELNETVDFDHNS